jgi:putative transposase
MQDGSGIDQLTGVVMDLHFFNPAEPTAIAYRRLPHWSQAGVVCFMTFRLHDSMPLHILTLWLEQRATWLRQHGIDLQHEHWRLAVNALAPASQTEFHRHFSTRWHDELDNAHGDCALRQPENARVVSDYLRHFDGGKYWLTDFVVMPNHVHLLVEFPDDESMLKQCENWKRYTARLIHLRMGTAGRFWQQDGFDHLVRSEAQFAWFRKYIADNPRKAGLRPDEFVHYSCDVLKRSAE